MGLALELIMPSYSQRFAFKPKPRKILKALLRNAFKIFLVVHLIGSRLFETLTTSIGTVSPRRY
jgi:hypothetical protein